MSTAVAIRTQTPLPAMIREVGLGEFWHGLVEGCFEGLFGFGNHLVAATRVELLCGLVEWLVEISTMVKTILHVGQPSDSGTEFLLEGWLFIWGVAGSLGDGSEDTGFHLIRLKDRDFCAIKLLCKGWDIKFNFNIDFI